ncbi:uncharacterized protein LOC130761003 isoform X2 [Actinidia eriantha]|uniref:uncharacterized protein LOC130761003 isoform X2 n=1 Tax=Actinidia eriantha TaxID=165200 RepID=UPI00258D18A3|nr:uncharacterized protein LOC130761003 isoform X2 [Actinidia eriantha]
MFSLSYGKRCVRITSQVPGLPTRMGIWAEFRLTAVKLFNGSILDPPRNSKETECLHDMGIAKAVTQFGDAVGSNGAKKLKEYVPDPDRREKIGRILTKVGRFAVDSAVNESLKSVTGGTQLYKIVKEEFKDQPSSFNPNDNKKPDLTVVMEEMQAKMEKMQEDMNNIKQQSKVSIQSAQESEPLRELPNEPAKGPAPQKAYPKKVFIRSRL